MEYGEGKTGCYRILIKGYQWIWATTRSYISFNHWNSKPEIYCSTTKVIRLVFEEPFSFCLPPWSNTRPLFPYRPFLSRLLYLRRAKPFMWKFVLSTEIIFVWKVLREDSFRNRGTENGELSSPIPWLQRFPLLFLKHGSYCRAVTNFSSKRGIAKSSRGIKKSLLLQP